MAILTIRNVPEEAHYAIRVRTARHGHSAEVEVRELLANAVDPNRRLCLGDALAELGDKIGLTYEDFARLDQVRDTASAEPMRFE